MLPELCERVFGRALPLFLATGALRGRFNTTNLGSVRLDSDCWVVVEVMTWLSIYTEWRACGSCCKSCEILVYCRMFACAVSLWSRI